MKPILRAGLGAFICLLVLGISGAALAGLVVKERYNANDPWGVIEETLLGNQDTQMYHYSWCALANKGEPGKYQMFSTVQHAKQDGYMPCDICRPPSRLGY